MAHNVPRAPSALPQKCDHHSHDGGGPFGPQGAPDRISPLANPPLACPTCVWVRSPPLAAGDPKWQAPQMGPARGGGQLGCAPVGISRITRARRTGPALSRGAPRRAEFAPRQIVGPQPSCGGVPDHSAPPPCAQEPPLSLLAPRNPLGPRWAHAGTTSHAGTAAPTGATTTLTVCSTPPSYSLRSAYRSPVVCRCRRSAGVRGCALTLWDVHPPRRPHARATDGRFCVCGVQEDPVARPTPSRCCCCCHRYFFPRHSLCYCCIHPHSRSVHPLASRVCVDRPHRGDGPPCRVAAVVLPVHARYVAADRLLRQQPTACGCCSVGGHGRGACTAGRSGGDVPPGRVGRRGGQAGH